MYIGRHARKLLISNPSNFSSWVRKKLVVSFNLYWCGAFHIMHSGLCQKGWATTQCCGVWGKYSDLVQSQQGDHRQNQQCTVATSLLGMLCAHVNIFERATQLWYTCIQIHTSLKKLQPLTQLAQTLARIWLGKDGVAGVSKALLAQLALLVRSDIYE